MGRRLNAPRRQSLISNIWNCILYLLVLEILDLSPVKRVNGLFDSIFDFSSFRDTNDWTERDHGPYYQTCSRSVYDTFREPRTKSMPDDLRAAQETLSPIKFRTDETNKSTEANTLFIYNYPGIRNGYSVSYGFQRDKECLHGEDKNCIVSPEFGRVRAVVVNAERFPGGHNLNYIKDHFLIEDQEKFVTILNGGSNFERKFYEAVFLGGYPNPPDESRSTHQIDGKSYPMEIYMYFVDESVPSVSLSTILVVLVEESDRDNPYVKPIVSAVSNNLYDKERHYVERNKALTRRLKLFHHMGKSIRYDINDVEENIKNNEPILQDVGSDVFRQESFASASIETFERLEALIAELYFLDEGLENSRERHGFLDEGVYDYLEGNENNDYFPFDNEAMRIMTFQATKLILKREVIGVDRPCDRYFNNQFYGRRNPLLSEDHLNKEKAMGKRICEYMVEWKGTWVNCTNRNNPGVVNMTYHDKYACVDGYRKLRHIVENMNREIYEHFHDINETSYPHAGPLSDEKINYRDMHHEHHVMSEYTRFFADFIKRAQFTQVITELEGAIETVRDNHDFSSEKSMRDVIHYIKFGEKNRKIQATREHFKQALQHSFMSYHHKKRGPVENGNMEMSEETIEEDKDRSPIKALVDSAFQISWLIPADGGYYHYSGSSPVPPCFRAQNVIVFKKPITMSKRQIEVLTRVPTAFNKYRDIRSTMPAVHDPVFMASLEGDDTLLPRFEEVVVPVFEQKKNHLFLGHDGVHKNAVEESELRKKRKKGGAAMMSSRALILIQALVFLQGAAKILIGTTY